MTTIFDVAAIAGEEVYRAPGHLWYPRFQVQFQLACLRRANYDDVQRARLRQHLLITGPYGWWKSSAAAAFVVDIAGCKDIVTMPKGRPSVPTFLGLGGQGITSERQRGGANDDGEPVEPLVVDPAILFAPELLSYLGRDPKEMQKRVDSLDELLEEGYATVSLVKMRNWKPDKERVAELENQGVTYNPDRGIMRYNVTCAFLACTVPFESKVSEHLASTGFLSRLHISNWEAKDEEVKRMFRLGAGKPGEAIEQLTIYNRKAWRIHFDRVEHPSDAMMSPVVAAYDRTFSRIEREMKIRAAELRTGRVRGEVAQIITAMAAARAVATTKLDEEELIKLEMDGQFHHVPALTYTESDVDNAVKWVEHNAANIFNEWTARARLDSKEASDRELFYGFLETVEGDAYDLADFAKYAVRKDLSKSAAYQRHAGIFRRGWTAASEKVGIFKPLREIMCVVHPERFGLYPGGPDDDEIDGVLTKDAQRIADERASTLSRWKVVTQQG